MSLTDGLVGAWVPALGPTAGVLLDRSAYSNHGTLTNMDPATDWQASGGGWCLDFDGSDDHVVTTRGAAVTSAVLSVSMWVYRRSSTVYPRLIDISDATHSLQAVIDTGPNGSGVVVTKHTQYQTGFTGTGWGFLPALQTWEHLAIVSDGAASLTRVWRNGAEQISGASGAVAAGTASNAIFFGVRRDLNSLTRLNGAIDDVRMFNRPLTPAEIKTLATRRGVGLERKRRRVYSIPAGPAFKAAWAARATTIAGVLR